MLQNSYASLSVSQSVEVVALKHESRILRQDKCPRILISCYRARNSGPQGNKQREIERGDVRPIGNAINDINKLE